MRRTLPARLRAWWRSRYDTGRPLPVVGVTLGRHVPGVALRALFVVAVAGLLLAAGARTTLITELSVAIAAVVTVWAAVRPGPAPAHVALLAAALLLLGSAAAPFDPAVVWLAPLAYVVTRLGWWASHVAAADRVELAALRHVAARDAVVLAVALVIGGAAWSLADRQVPWLVALGVAALAALAWTAVRRDDGEAR
ncbi:hypothetical protein AAG589_04070 [Isoptericola sp. F-RaC21]|uniref:hypothetical protein n=1 Tax=Isoptericola sp. F-RaC21 TaxID=3141452 RepID=UPI00315BE391